MDRQCLNCRWLKMDDVVSGLCRKEKGEKAKRPQVKVSDLCDSWQDAGPQYHIRMGWIKNQKKKV